MNGNDQTDQRWLTARHEAGHAVAALHYDCPLGRVSIEGDGNNAGVTALADPEFRHDAVVIYCGPLAEKDWAEFRPNNYLAVPVVGRDYLGLERIRARCGPDLHDCLLEATLFLGKPAVQAQVDRVARALVERTSLTADQVREISEFGEPLCSPGWR
jgi:hypothetical protein